MHLQPIIVHRISSESLRKREERRQQQLQQNQVHHDDYIEGLDVNCIGKIIYVILVISRIFWKPTLNYAWTSNCKWWELQLQYQVLAIYSKRFCNL